MKDVLFLIMLISFSSAKVECQALQQYLVYTTTLDSFILSQVGQSDSLLTSELADNSRYRLNCTHPETTTITLIRKDCEHQPSFVIWSKTENAYTERVYLNSGERISIAACFRQTATNSWLEYSRDQIVKFFKKTREGALECPRISTTLGNPDTTIKNSLIYYTVPDSIVYYDWESFEIDFYIEEYLKIEEIAIINTTQNNQLLCVAGDSLKVKEIYGEEAKFVSEVKQLIKPLASDKKEWKKYQINAENLKGHLYKKIDAGNDYYQLNLMVITDKEAFRFVNFRMSTQQEEFFKLKNEK